MCSHTYNIPAKKKKQRLSTPRFAVKRYEEIYYTFDPEPVYTLDTEGGKVVSYNMTDICTPGVPNIGALMAKKLYAVQKWNDAFAPSVGLTCPGQPKYAVGREQHFCAGTNSPAMYSTGIGTLPHYGSRVLIKFCQLI